MKMRKCMSAIFMVESQGNALYLRLQNFIVTKATINLNLWRNDSELYHNGNMGWNMDISEVPSNGTYYFRRCYDYRTGY